MSAVTYICVIHRPYAVLWAKNHAVIDFSLEVVALAGAFDFYDI
jgi:hypothetical protein